MATDVANEADASDEIGLNLAGRIRIYAEMHRLTLIWLRGL